MYLFWCVNRCPSRASLPLSLPHAAVALHVFTRTPQVCQPTAAPPAPQGGEDGGLGGRDHSHGTLLPGGLAAAEKRNS